MSDNVDVGNKVTPSNVVDVVQAAPMKAFNGTKVTTMDYSLDRAIPLGGMHDSYG